MANPNQEIKYTKLFIGNKFVDSKTGKTYPSVNPATAKTLGNIAEADKADVDLAVQAANYAFKMDAPWRMMDASQRGELMFRLVELIQRDMNVLANLETLDTGKPLADSLLDIKHVIDVFRYFAGYADKIHGRTVPVDGQDLMSIIRKEPIGVVAQILSYDFPMVMLAWKVAPALAAGNTLVIKPSFKTPLTALYFAALTMEAELPQGVINVLTGHGEIVGQALANHMDVMHIAFTGRTETGKLIMEYASKSNLKKVSLQLSGNSPLVVLKDFDMKLAVEIAHRAIFVNQGQSTSASGRIYVQEEIYDDFVKRSVELARKRVVGNPFDSNVRQGPLVDEKLMTRVMNYVAAGTKQGAKLEFGGKRIGTTGFFIEPTIFSNVKDDMQIAQEEIFGPVQLLLKFKTLEEVIERANNSKFGVAAGILTYNIDNALWFAKYMRAGSMWVNTWDAITPQAPFGGFKQSGHGRDLGYEAMLTYLETKTISMRMVYQQLKNLK